MKHTAVLVKYLAAVIIVAGALAFRLRDLDAEPFWVDEAESSINALTILEHGYPTDSYLGLPIYENTLTQPWPNHPEYAFRDVSYSDKGIAIYHGWVPLYSIAASFAAHGIWPDKAGPPHVIKYSPAERKRRTASARLPGVLFGVGFVVLAFIAGTALFDEGAGWAAGLLACIHSDAIALSRQARYYSAEVLFTTLCCFLSWLMVRRAGWKHVIACAVAFVLLFHTHLQSFFAAGLTLALAVPVMLRLHGRVVKKLAAFGAIVAAGTVPWLMLTGFLAHQARIPRAWPLLQFPGDLMRYPPFNYVDMGIAAVFAIGVIWTLWGRYPKSVSRLRIPLLSTAPVLAFVAVWALCAYATFFATMPAVSFTSSRLKLGYLGPAILAAGVMCAATGRIINARMNGVAAASVVAIGMFLLSGRSFSMQNPSSGAAWRKNTEVLEQLKEIGFDDQTKFYASPNVHLIWTFYSGLPVQSMGPIRQEYLAGYQGTVIYIDSFSRDRTLSADLVKESAQMGGCTLSTESAGQLCRLLVTRDYRESILRDVGVRPETRLEQAPGFTTRLLKESRKRAGAEFDKGGLEFVTRNAGFEVRSWRDWRMAFLYRFATQQAFRPDAAVNYGTRLRHSHAVILVDSGVAIYKSVLAPHGHSGDITFIFDPPVRPDSGSICSTREADRPSAASIASQYAGQYAEH
jgi:hypothetical protein